MFEKIISEYMNVKLGLIMNMPYTFKNKKSMEGLPSIPTIGRVKRIFKFKGLEKISHDYSSQNFKVYRWLGSFEGDYQDLKEMLNFEFSTKREKAGEPLISFEDSTVRNFSNGVCLVYSSDQVNAVYETDCYSVVRGNLLFPTANQDTFVKEFSGNKFLFGEAFIKRNEKPKKIIVLTLVKYVEVLEYLIQENLNIEVELKK